VTIENRHPLTGEPECKVRGIRLVADSSGAKIAIHKYELARRRSVRRSGFNTLSGSHILTSPQFTG